MIHELVYTSAAETFDGPGYGVVARTREIPDAVQRQMLRMSRFDFLDSEHHSANRPPEMVSHTIVSDMQVWHIFSRTGSAGMDYTNRTVFLAHHVAVAQESLDDMTPFDLILSPDLFRTVWTGEPSILPTRTLDEIRGGKCQPGTWRKMFGTEDAMTSWQQMHLGKIKPLFLLSRSSQDNLQMFCEAARQLDSQVARDITFISALGADQKGIRFDWIGLLAGTKLSDSVMKVAADKVFDVTRPKAFKRYKSHVPNSATHVNARPSLPSPVERAGTPEADTYELCWQEDLATTTKTRRNLQLDSLPPPPPPTARSSRARLIWAAAAGIVLAGGAGLMAMLVLSPPPGKDIATTDAIPRDKHRDAAPDRIVDGPHVDQPVRKDTRSGTAVSGLSDVPSPQPSDTKSDAGHSKRLADGGGPQTTPAIPLKSEYPTAGYYYVDKGLMTASEIGRDRWIQIATLPKEPTLKDITIVGNLVESLHVEAHESIVRLSVKGATSPPIGIRCTEANQIELQIPGKTSERDLQEVFSRMRLCLLRLEGAPISDRAQQKVRYEVMFNPLQPALRSSFKSNDNSSEQDFFEFCIAAVKHKADVICRIESVAVLPSSTILVNESREVKGTTRLLFPLSIRLTESRTLKLDLPIEPAFDREAPDNQTRAPLQMFRLTSEGEAGKDQKNASQKEPGKTVGRTRPLTREPVLKDRANLTDSDDDELLAELFARFGSASGVLLMRVEENDKTYEFPAVRFGSQPTH